MTQASIEIALLIASIGLLILYRFLHARRARLDPFSSTRTVHNSLRVQWAGMVTSTADRGILAVQTLRNSVMAASFMASTSALALAGSLGFASEADRLAAIWHRDHALPMASALFPFKVFLLLGAFFTAFLLFSLLIRLYDIAGYAVVLPEGAKSIAHFINRAGSLYGDGLRVFYMTIPVVAWLFDATMMLAATAGVLWIRWHLDTTDIPQG